VVANFGALMFVLLPLFALRLQVLDFRSRLPCTAHLVFALHLRVFRFLLLAVTKLERALLTWVGLAVIVVHTMLAGRRVYLGGCMSRLLRGVALSLRCMTLLAVTVLLA